MDWQDKGILLSLRGHGESSAIIEVLTSEHGRYAGLVRGGASQKMSAHLQPGAQVAVEWRARLEEHLGHFTVEPMRPRAADIMRDRGTLAAFNAMAALSLSLIPEREPDPAFYKATIRLADALADNDPEWTGVYARWEVTFLESAGFGLDLDRCAATGTRHDLAFVSPRTGRAVSRQAGGPFADKLLPLPGFLIDKGKLSIPAMREALRMTGWFLEHRVCPAMERESVPEARERLIRLLSSERYEPAPRGPKRVATEREEALEAEHKRRLLAERPLSVKDRKAQF